MRKCLVLFLLLFLNVNLYSDIEIKPQQEFVEKNIEVEKTKSESMFDNISGLQYGGFAIGGILITMMGAFWQKVREFFQNIFALVFVTASLHQAALISAKIHIVKHFKRSPLYNPIYDSTTWYVNKEERNQFVVWEYLTKAGTFWGKKWGIPFPIWISDDGVTYMRGTVNINEIIQAGLDEINDFRFNTQKRKKSGARRFFVKRISDDSSRYDRAEGQADEPEEDSKAEVRVDHHFSAIDHITFGTNKLLKWDLTDIGEKEADGKKMMDFLYYPKEVDGLSNEIDFWIKNKDWFKKRHIPWKRGWLLYGAPGTGKTVLVKALGHDFDLPIYSYDLSTMSNHSFVKHWKRMQSDAPAIALLEDFDVVFCGRENQGKNETRDLLSFDTLLNTIDGAENSEGIFTIITTNNIDCLDSAIGQPSGDGGFISSRPGRIDRALELGKMMEKAREMMAERILGDWPELKKGAVAEGEEDTPAQFQERCSQIAFKQVWNETK